jgi:hypothetical protein
LLALICDSIIYYPLLVASALCLLCSAQAKELPKCEEATSIPDFAASWPLSIKAGSSTLSSEFHLNKTTDAYKQAGLHAPDGIDYTFHVWVNAGTDPLEWSIQAQNYKVADDAPDGKQLIYTVHFGSSYSKSWYLSGLTTCKTSMIDDYQHKPDYETYAPTADLTQYNI